ncbi:MAG: hypothetical protein L0Z71_07665 [Anaerolineae bacterium]|nr:hypothetical protein [Anaerolineae bacterium]
MNSNMLKPPGAWKRENWLSAILVILVTLLTYAPLISQLGFYRDDWYLIWVAQYQGSEGIIALFRGDRPLFGWLYALDYLLLGDAPLGWHILGLMIKIITALGTLWLLRSLWPQHRLETTLMTLLYVVYPGFFQQPNVGTFMNHFMAYAAAIFSLACTVQTLKTNSAWSHSVYSFLGLALAAFYIFTYEALIGMEAVRLLLIGYFYYRQNASNWKTTIRNTLIRLSPYLLLALGFVLWRLFVFQATRRSTRVDILVDEYLSFPLHNAARLILETLKDLFETSILAWGVPFYQFTVHAEYRVLAQALVLALMVVILTGGYWFLSRKQAAAVSEADPYPYAGRDWLILGAASVIVTTIPIIAAGRDVFFSLQFDRYTFQSILGVVLFVGGFIFYILRDRFRWVLLGALFVSGVTTQFLSADYYRDFWAFHRNMIWELSWRAPHIEDRITVIFNMPQDYGFAEEYEVWAPLNLVYYPNEPLKLTGQIMLDELWVDMARGTQEDRLIRDTISVQRDYGKVIILSKPTPLACLHVLDGGRSEQAVSEPPEVRFVAKYSNVEWIDTTGAPAIPSRAIFGVEPPHDWCYFYQKIDLARQRMDWQAAAELADQARSLGLSPKDTSEWLPALEAYIHVGDTKKSRQIARLIRVNRYVYTGLCEQMKALQGQPADYDRDLLRNTLCKAD